MVLFDSKGSFIVPGKIGEMDKIPKLIQQLKDHITLEEDPGVYLMLVWVNNRSLTENNMSASSQPVR